MPEKEIIEPPVQPVSPNMANYEQEYKSFRWEQVLDELSGFPGREGLNIAHEAVDRHAVGKKGAKVALRWIAENGTSREFTYNELKQETDRFANVLVKLGIQKGDVVCTLTGRIPELYITALGTLKNGSVYCPLFSIYGPEPIYQRLSKGKAKVLVTTEMLYRKKVAGLMDRLAHLKYVLLTDVEKEQNDHIRSLPKLMGRAKSSFKVVATAPEDQALLHFTSGTTGMPKGVVHVHQAALTHYITGKYVLDFHPDDRFWCTADPGWVTGTSYGILAPLMHGITNIVVEAEFDARLWYSILEEQKVTVWYTAPTAIRRLMRMDIDVRKEYDLRALRLILSVGEPLNPEAVRWAQKTLGMPILDNWWQTETGGIMIANYPSMPVRPGSMGKPLPGIKAAIITPDNKEAEPALINTPGDSGHLALKAGWPSMFRGYLDEHERYVKCFANSWYLTGDLASRDEDGYFWFVGRADDIIKTAGHMVGPFEVENILMEHPAVAEAAVIGKPDPMMGELVKAFVTLKSNFEATEELNLEIKGFARERLGPAVAPKEIEFTGELPKTRSGKIMRRLLRDQEREKVEK
ncbi:acetate--CoA ligase [Halalkalibaculum sp. DA3122]|uniref:acetate--CoA ligase n=1 Tax=Halalkalibaculum sp. DA3122 TaxID=3373607 RepID=UPI00375439F2